MKGTSRFAIGLAAALLFFFAVSPSFAQCPMARVYGNQDFKTTSARGVIVTTNAETTCSVDGNEFGGLWVTNDPTTNSGGPYFGTPDLCPIQSGNPNTGPWWITGTKLLGPNAGIQGAVSSPGCQLTRHQGICRSLNRVLGSTWSC